MTALWAATRRTKLQPKEGSEADGFTLLGARRISAAGTH